MLLLFDHMLVFLGLAYLFTKTAVFTALVNNTLTFPDKIIIYLVFAGFSILGTSLSEPSSQMPDAIVNTRAIGAVLGGILGGPLVGLLVGLTGGIYRLWNMSCIDASLLLGRNCVALDPVHDIDIACIVATALEGLFAGYVHYFQLRKGKINILFSPQFVLLVTLIAESGHMLIILLFGWHEFTQTLNLIKEIAPPMLMANALGVAIVIYMIREQKESCDNMRGSAIAWRIATKTAESMFSGLRESSQALAQIIQQETQASAVSVTDTTTLLAFTGEGEDHHIPGMMISSSDTQKAIVNNRVSFVDGIKKPYQCEIENKCLLGSVLIIPLQNTDNEVFGTIELYESKSKLFRNINLTLGKEIRHLLANQILLGEREQKKSLETEEQLKLLRAQINPHFLYNSLATIAAITKKQPDKARDLILNLSDFFRANLKTPGHICTLKEEYKHLKSYLEIEKARYKDKLQVQIDIPEQLMDKTLPIFTLQPMVENAIEHGTSERVHLGIVSISAIERGEKIFLIIEDNAGLYIQRDSNNQGIGLTLDRRIKLLYGDQYGVSVECKEKQWAKFTISLPNRDNET